MAATALHLATANHYGIFRDELYYIACARHLDFGYVDHPPLIAWLTWLVLHSLGSSLFALRLLPALASGGLVWFTAQMAREWGGGRFAQCLAALAILPVPIYLILQHWLTMNAFEPLLWTAAIWAVSRMVLRQEPRWWLVVGLLAGIGLENKYSMSFLAVSLVAGLMLTPERRWLKSRYFYVAIVLAALLFMPNVLWLIQHHFPFLEFEKNSRAAGSRILRNPAAFLLDQAVIMNPVLAPLWIGGLAWLFTKSARPLRFVGWTASLLMVAMVILKAKNYYVAPVYPVLFAAGSVWMERAALRERRWWSTAYIATVVVSGILLAPLVMPILSVPQFAAYRQLWQGFTPVVFELEPGAVLPQYFSDEFGWEAMARTTANVFAALPPAERSRTAIFANDYGQAAAIDFFGPRYGLPSSISKAESYWLWGPRDYDGSTVIVLGSDGQGDRPFFRTVEPTAVVGHPYARADERFRIFLCRGLHPALPVLWPRIKSW